MAILSTYINLNSRMNHTPCQEWNEITYSFPNVNLYTIEVWEGIGDFILYQMLIDIITHLCCWV